MDESDTKTCPFCAETIRAAALKCRFCGEFLDQGDYDGWDDEERQDDEDDGSGPAWEWGRFGWQCLEHKRGMCVPCTEIVKPPTRLGSFRQGTLFPGTDGQPYEPYRSTAYVERSGYQGKPRKREKLSKVGQTTDSGLACPRCGGTSFTAKRSMTGKILVGVLAPKTRVRCVTCGLMFVRG